MKIYGLEQAPRLVTDLRSVRVAPPEGEEVIYVGSGKAAIALILSYLKTKGTLPNKMTPILMPEWLGTWVYAQVLPYAFPTLRTDVNVPAVFCYHQYGFPQNMDRVLEIAEARGAIVIEDCAHAACSFFKGRPLGSMGAFGFFSFSKFVFCYTLGGVVAKDSKFRAFVSEQNAKASTLLRLFVNGVKYCSEWSNERASPRAVQFFNGLTAMAYSRYGEQVAASHRATSLWLSKQEAEVAARRQNFRLLRAKVDELGICDHLESHDVTPYAVPLYVKEDKSDALVSELRKRGVVSGVYHFDFARCVFEPDFRRCVLVPIHSGMAGRGMELVTDAIEKCL
jgi:dTDP-4-amino-4,6-dideoxygalactose transaminase